MIIEINKTIKIEFGRHIIYANGTELGFRDCGAQDDLFR